jgi:hypothetical protein
LSCEALAGRFFLPILTNAAYLSRSFEYRSGMDFDLACFQFPFKRTPWQNFEASDYLDVTFEFTFQLQLPRGDVRVDMRIAPQYQKIGRFHLTGKPAVDFDREIVTELAGYGGIREENGSRASPVGIGSIFLISRMGHLNASSRIGLR